MFNVLMCKFYKFYICPVVGVIINISLDFILFIPCISDNRFVKKFVYFVGLVSWT